jgi:hypothetical protein
MLCRSCAANGSNYAHITPWGAPHLESSAAPGPSYTIDCHRPKPRLVQGSRKEW